ncbi:hypothetical protein JHK84_048196 [Glycine max]|uniref:Uncharacterized protein n=1 Tax=Glycine max TaxID=3847 RepID=K7MMW6_SOYBN|nr:hypothetical protein JHK87_047959 [Glycine soja]KAG4944144.1 hypothetical protein JHK85_048790 [Glycine max]KAG5103227.1 hypothetical protein JHK84_048196 [Glycine max]KAH1119315.1 hypothetical protein GYH30_047917 [Glycine max]KAH1203422.1 hypothetical protein GmHk_17G049677 [Glycine max]
MLLLRRTRPLPLKNYVDTKKNTIPIPSRKKKLLIRSLLSSTSFASTTATSGSSGSGASHASSSDEWGEVGNALRMHPSPPWGAAGAGCDRSQPERPPTSPNQ